MQIILLQVFECLPSYYFLLMEIPYMIPTIMRKLSNITCIFMWKWRTCSLPVIYFWLCSCNFYHMKITTNTIRCHVNFMHSIFNAWTVRIFVNYCSGYIGPLHELPDRIPLWPGGLCRGLWVGSAPRPSSPRRYRLPGQGLVSRPASRGGNSTEKKEASIIICLNI